MNEDFEYIENRDSLIRCCKKLKFEKEIGVDIECENNFHHYGVYISIIQLSTNTENFIVDVLKLKEISPLIEILENKDIIKIFHNVDFDFRILRKQFNCKRVAIFMKRCEKVIKIRDEFLLIFFRSERCKEM